MDHASGAVAPPDPELILCRPKMGFWPWS